MLFVVGVDDSRSRPILFAKEKGYFYAPLIRRKRCIIGHGSMPYLISRYIYPENPILLHFGFLFPPKRRIYMCICEHIYIYRYKSIYHSHTAKTERASRGEKIRTRVRAYARASLMFNLRKYKFPSHSTIRLIIFSEGIYIPTC